MLIKKRYADVVQSNLLYKSRSCVSLGWIGYGNVENDTEYRFYCISTYILCNDSHARDSQSRICAPTQVLPQNPSALVNKVRARSCRIIAVVVVRFLVSFKYRYVSALVGTRMCALVCVGANARRLPCVCLRVCANASVCVCVAYIKESRVRARSHMSYANTRMWYSDYYLLALLAARTRGPNVCVGRASSGRCQYRCLCIDDLFFFCGVRMLGGTYVLITHRAEKNHNINYVVL